MRIQKRPKTTSISFRLEQELANQLKREAIPKGLSLHTAARERLLTSLIEQPIREGLDELQGSVTGLKAMVHQLRQDLVNLYELLSEDGDLEE